jgi:hypothetical protein
LSLVVTEAENGRLFSFPALGRGAALFPFNPNPAIEKSRFAREGRRTVVV